MNFKFIYTILFAAILFAINANMEEVECGDDE